MFQRGFLLSIGFLVAVVAAPAQDESFVKPIPNRLDSGVRVNELRDGKRRMKDDEAKHKADLLIMAKALVYPVTQRQYYDPQPPNPKKPNELAPIPDNMTLRQPFDDLDRYILKPGPNSKLNFDQYDYLLEFGVALDAVFRELIVPAAPPEVRVNAARMLALAARSGAPAHAAQITQLIADPATRPEVLVYALKAAEGLLAAHDPRIGGVGTSLEYGKHTIPTADLVKLIQAIEAVIHRQTPYGVAAVKSPAAVSIVEPKGEKTVEKPVVNAAKKDNQPQPTKGTSGKLESEAAPAEPRDPEQDAVIRFIRRAAIRALAQVRQPVVTDTKANVTVRPLTTLCRIAVNDGRNIAADAKASDLEKMPPAPFVPKLGPDEYAIAVLGLSNLHFIKGVDLDVVLNCISIGIGNFAAKKVGTSDTSIAWRDYALRLNASFTEWPKIFTATTPIDSKVSPLLSLISGQILTPIEQLNKNNPTAAGFGLQGLVAWQANRSFADMVPFTDLTGDEKVRNTLKPMRAGN